LHPQIGDSVLQDLFFAILVSMWFLAPLAAGNAAVQPGSNPIPWMLGCWAVAGVVFAGSVFLIGPTWRKRQLGFLLGVGVAAWMITFYPMAETFWAVVGVPK
jgi:hypothetical protein